MSSMIQVVFFVNNYIFHPHHILPIQCLPQRETQCTNLNLESLNKVISESLEGQTMHTKKTKKMPNLFCDGTYLPVELQ